MHRDDSIRKPFPPMPTLKYGVGCDISVSVATPRVHFSSLSMYPTRKKFILGPQKRYVLIFPCNGMRDECMYVYSDTCTHALKANGMVVRGETVRRASASCKVCNGWRKDCSLSEEVEHA